MRCSKCGAEVNSNVFFCPSCGTTAFDSSTVSEPLKYEDSLAYVLSETPAPVIEPDPVVPDYAEPPQSTEPITQNPYAPPYVQIAANQVAPAANNSPYQAVPIADLRMYEPANGMAIAAFVLGIISMVGFCFCSTILSLVSTLPLSILAIIFGGIGLGTKKTSKSKGFAVAGLVLGIISLLLGVVLVVIFLFFAFGSSDVEFSNLNEAFSFFE
ncbi:MAG: hypothetical protein LBS74_02370 [Oscillospiraceae bacterium]|jgi:hypothetical protein|nr:hypothetical protein [Oscillospiraceae bacterium]